MKRTRTLIVMRHGHAEDERNNSHEGGDYARRLSASGERAVRLAGQQLYDRGIQLDCVIASSAPRAADSAHLAADACGFGGVVQTDRALYLATADAYAKALRQMSNDARTVLLVGHNPGLSHLVEQLSGQACSLLPAQYELLSLSHSAWHEVLT